MLEIFLIILIVFFVLIFFYKQTVAEFNILQIEADKIDTLPDILAESHPIVVRGLGSPKVLTLDVLKGNQRIQTLPVAPPYVLNQYLADPVGKTLHMLPPDIRKQAAGELGVHVWADHTWFGRIKEDIPYAFTMSLDSEVFMSSMGMRKTVAAYTLIYPTNGTFTASILMESATKFLPADWEGKFVSDLKTADCPLLNEVQFMDVILRPGHMFILPPHWIVSLRSSDTPPVFAWIEVHHPISKLASALA
jgi:hypothetical protein